MGNTWPSQGHRPPSPVRRPRGGRTGGAVARGNISKEQAAERHAFRLGRKALITRQPPAQIHVILDESSIRWQVGGPTVMGPQLDHLVSLPNSLT
ncbi:Scr1 family TA system antitoxin-like transcriptional regulator [Kitasatospora sp. NPDC101801]|uniref:Scr1 family TA system antitoxin-like transcriptional regulator n=1 Tax=Kitasatospora sp. NPDC101801 TaxID=3364103 RepID=UPI0037FE8697